MPRVNSTIKVDPVDCDRLRIVFEEPLWQLYLKVAILQRNGLQRFAIIANHTNLHPEWTFDVQWRVLASILPQANPLLVVVARHGRIDSDLAIRNSEAFQPLQMKSEHNHVRPLLIHSFDNDLADSNWTVDREKCLVFVDFDFDGRASLSAVTTPHTLASTTTMKAAMKSFDMVAKPFQSSGRSS